MSLCLLVAIHIYISTLRLLICTQTYHLIYMLSSPMIATLLSHYDLCVYIWYLVSSSILDHSSLIHQQCILSSVAVIHINTQMCIHQSYTRIHIYHIRCRGLMTILVMCISCINSSHHYHIYIMQWFYVAGVLYSIIVYDHISDFTATIYIPNFIEISSLIS